MKATRRKTLAASPADVWAIAGDPAQLGRWWPRVERIESTENTGFTEVFRAKSGRSVRADFKIAALVEERELAFVQQVEGTPFERVLTASRTTIRLEPDGQGTKVELEIDQSMTGMSKFGGPLARRALTQQLSDALDGLAAALTS